MESRNFQIIVIALLLVVAGFLAYFAFRPSPSYSPAPEIEQVQIVGPVSGGSPEEQFAANIAANTQPADPAWDYTGQTYTYKNHGFTIELPVDFETGDDPAEGGPNINIALPNQSILMYYSDASWWEKYVRPDYKYLGETKIGTTTFSLYKYNNHTSYWFKQGTVGYEFMGDPNLLKTFKFVGWK